VIEAKNSPYLAYRVGNPSLKKWMWSGVVHQWDKDDSCESIHRRWPSYRSEM